ncbi:MAG TPA: LD-carboxypeptidase [Lachnospiraceae bacterium]|nr:LD-carboxypeptidase [Lachnospiraceae bacterium]
MLKYGDKVGIVACSDARTKKEEGTLKELTEILTGLGLSLVFSCYIFEKRAVFSGSAEQRAGALNALYKDHDIKAIFDISGGDIANELLAYIDFDLIREDPKPFFGYSDLTTIVNAIYKKTGNASYLYQVNCLVWENGKTQTANFKNSLFNGSNDLYEIKWEFVRGAKVEGIVAGGNIRCFLKLAGTQYMPDLDNKILFLESYGGGVAQMETCLCQLKQMGVFDKISGLLLGTFTKMEEKDEHPDMTELVLNITGDFDFPIAKTREVGHQNTSKCLIIGKKYVISSLES